VSDILLLLFSFCLPFVFVFCSQFIQPKKKKKKKKKNRVLLYSNGATDIKMEPNTFNSSATGDLWSTSATSAHTASTAMPMSVPIAAALAAATSAAASTSQQQQQQVSSSKRHHFNSCSNSRLPTRSRRQCSIPTRVRRRRSPRHPCTLQQAFLLQQQQALLIQQQQQLMQQQQLISTACALPRRPIPPCSTFTARSGNEEYSFGDALRHSSGSPTRSPFVTSGMEQSETARLLQQVNDRHHDRKAQLEKIRPVQRQLMLSPTPQAFQTLATELAAAASDGRARGVGAHAARVPASAVAARAGADRLPRLGAHCAARAGGAVSAGARAARRRAQRRRRRRPASSRRW
jgi:hypothetical protein